jgi:cytochrome c
MTMIIDVSGRAKIPMLKKLLLVLVLATASFAASVRLAQAGENTLQVQDNDMGDAGYGAGAGIIVQTADPARGRKLFVSKGCVLCHAINDVGGTTAPPLDAEAMSAPLDPLEFVARMWRGAEAMIFMQQQELGEQIEFSAQELADIIAFVNAPEEQRRFAEDDIPLKYRALIRRGQ